MSAITTVSVFQKDAKPRTYQAGEIIFEEGEIGTAMFGVIQGSVELWVNNKRVETIEEGDVFGEGALVQPSSNRASRAIAKTDCQLAVLTKDRFMFALQNTPMFAIELMRSFSSRLRRLKQQVVQ